MLFSSSKVLSLKLIKFLTLLMLYFREYIPKLSEPAHIISPSQLDEELSYAEFRGLVIFNFDIYYGILIF